METLAITIIKFLMIIGLSYAEVTLPAYYHDGMVMQADQDQTLIWGFTTNLLQPVMVTVSCDLEGRAFPHKTYLASYPNNFKHSTAVEVSVK